MVKRSVATDTGELSPNEKKVIECLKAHPEGINPKSISRKTGVNVNTVKSILPKIPNVQKPMRGVYKIVDGGDGTQSQPTLTTLESWNFHNCIMSLKDVAHVPDQTIDTGLVKVAMSDTNGKATCRVSTDHPLNVSSLTIVAELFAGYYGKQVEDVTVSSIEFNKDYRNLRLDGVNCITIDSLVSQFKLYQKTLGLRMEHKTKVSFTMDNIVALLSQNPMAGDTIARLDKLNEKISFLSEAVQRLQRGIVEAR